MKIIDIKRNQKINFSSGNLLKTKFAVIIGENGVGKTRLLNDIDNLIQKKIKNNYFARIESKNDYKILYIPAERPEDLWGLYNKPRISKEAWKKLKSSEELPFLVGEIRISHAQKISDIKQKNIYEIKINNEKYNTIDFALEKLGKESNFSFLRKSFYRLNWEKIFTILLFHFSSILELISKKIDDANIIFNFATNILNRRVDFDDEKPWNIIENFCNPKNNLPLPQLPCFYEIMSLFKKSYLTNNPIRFMRLSHSLDFRDDFEMNGMLSHYGLTTVKFKDGNIFSSGHKRMLEMVLCIYTFVSENLNSELLIAIDEVDLFLHPNLVFKLISILDEIGNQSSKVNFLITTHNTLIINAFERKQVYIMKENSIGNPHFETFGKSNDFLLRKIFGLESSINQVASRFLKKEMEELYERMLNEEIKS